MQLGLTTQLHTALIDHTLYGAYADILEQLGTLGFKVFASRKVDRPHEAYQDPLLENRWMALTNYLAFSKI